MEKPPCTDPSPVLRTASPKGLRVMCGKGMGEQRGERCAEGRKGVFYDGLFALH